MHAKRKSVSIVIPAYNEESHLHLCLDAIAAQTVRAHEVIVVDNASTDATAAIARSYDFVTVIREEHQGVVYARDTGFNAATGDIIGRIDADTVLSPSWVSDVQAIFDEGDVDAVSGSLSFTDMPLRQFFARVDRFFRRYLARSLAGRGELFLFGGNMAMTRSAWRAVRSSVCHFRRFHEDMDLAAHFTDTAMQVGYDERMHASVSVRRLDSPAKDYYPYVWASSRTYAAHGLRGRYYMYPVEMLVTIVYLPLRLLYRGYDPTTREFSLKRALQVSAFRRASPVSDTI